MRFKPGQKVICIRAIDWVYDNQTFSAKPIGPKKDEIVTVWQYNPDDETYIILSEYRKHQSGWMQSFEEKNFEPLMDISELTAILEHQTQTV